MILPACTHRRLSQETPPRGRAQEGPASASGKESVGGGLDAGVSRLSDGETEGPGEIGSRRVSEWGRAGVGSGLSRPVELWGLLPVKAKQAGPAGSASLCADPRLQLIEAEDPATLRLQGGTPHPSSATAFFTLDSRATHQSVAQPPETCLKIEEMLVLMFFFFFLFSFLFFTFFSFEN